MRKFIYLVSFVIIVTLFSSCNYRIIKKNKENLKSLHIGMSKQEVLDLMGEPLKGEVYNTKNVWYYFTEVKWSDGAITRDECTPIYFVDGKVAGWGQDAYKKFRQKDW